MASTTSTSSPPLFSGMPALIADAYAWKDTFDSILSKALYQALGYATNSLRYAAEQDPEWAPYADLLRVEVNEDGELEWKVYGTPDQIKAVEELEYGTIGQSPRPLLRTQIKRQTDIMRDRVDIILSQEAIANA